MYLKHSYGRSGQGKHRFMSINSRKISAMFCRILMFELIIHALEILGPYFSLVRTKRSWFEAKVTSFLVFYQGMWLYTHVLGI